MNQNFGDFFLSCKECVLENPRNFYGSFTLGPFQNSQSLTVANALRRTLFTEILNIAITHIEIDGVFHEYSTIEGVRESVLDILLNFKQIVLKTSSHLVKPVYGYVNVRGPGIVRVSDLKLPPNIEYVDPDQYIATLNENGKLCLKFRISDFCFAVLEKAENEKKNQMDDKKSDEQKLFSKPFSQIGFENESAQNLSEKKRSQILKTKKTKSFVVDANFNPILKVNYFIENLQPIQNSFGKEIVHIELWTNGSIHPRKALKIAISFLKNMFDKFEDMEKVNSRMAKSFFESDSTFVEILKTFEYNLNFSSAIESKPSTFLQENKANAKSSSFLLNQFEEKEKNLDNSTVSVFHKFSLNSSIYVLNLPYRVSQCLIQNNFLTIEDLVKFRAKELRKLSGIGNFSLSLIQKKLKKIGFELKS